MKAMPEHKCPACGHDMYVTVSAAIPFEWAQIHFESAAELRLHHGITTRWQVECTEGHVLALADGTDDYHPYDAVAHAETVALLAKLRA